MSTTDLEQRLDDYNRVITVINQASKLHPNIAYIDIPRVYQLSIAMQNTLRGLSAYGPNAELDEIVQIIEKYCDPRDVGSAASMKIDTLSSHIQILEDIAFRAQLAGFTQLSQLHGAAPNIQLELGLDELKQLKPRSFENNFGTYAHMDLLQNDLRRIQDILIKFQAPKPTNWVARENAPNPISLSPLATLLQHTSEALQTHQTLDYEAQKALPLLHDKCQEILSGITNVAHPTADTIELLFDTLNTIAVTLPPSHNADALKREALSIRSTYVSSPQQRLVR